MTLKPAGIIERKLGTFAIRLLKRVGDMAAKRGDMHEWQHCTYGVLVAHSTHSDGCKCVNDAVHEATRGMFEARS